MLGEAFDKFGSHYPAVPADRAALEEWLPRVPALFGAGIRPMPIWIQEGGLGSVGDGLKLLREGKVRPDLTHLAARFETTRLLQVSGEKVVYLLDDFNTTV